MSATHCYHCGERIIGKPVTLKDKSFCCTGCRSVYSLLEENGLDSFYSIDQQPGTKPVSARENAYAFLDVEELRRKYIDFEDGKSTHVTLFIPAIHCSSCIYLLENLHRIDPRVQSSVVNFTRRQTSIVFSREMKLSELAVLLDAIGYAPNFSSRTDISKKRNYTYLYKLGVAGFAFGSIMLWSFPEYLGIENENPEFRSFTSWLTFGISLPVLFYSANEYLISAWKAIRHKSLNLDVPITLGIIALYAQSCYSIFSGDGPGYMDSFAAFIFFLLIGKWFQNKTYEALSFERDYTAYFPVAVTRVHNGREEIVEIDALEEGDTMLIRNQEIVPCDATLLADEIRIDYSFVTGESVPVICKKGDLIYAGGKLLGSKSRFEVVRKSSRSHLTQLWNEGERRRNKEEVTSDKLSIYFLIAVLTIAFFTGIAWLFTDQTRVAEVVVAVLIVACPCALALSKPFTYGNTMRSLGRKGLYLKNNEVIPRMNEVTDIVFDKTGTLTTSSTEAVVYEGSQLTDSEKAGILTIVHSSTHPLSRALVDQLKDEVESEIPEINNYTEESGKGMTAMAGNMEFRIGSAAYTHPEAHTGENETCVHIAINGSYKGRFVFSSVFRPGILASLPELSKNYTLHVLSGDRDKDRSRLEQEASCIRHLHFQQSPADKYHYIQSLQAEGKKVMMIGDGLNDAGALDLSDVGIAVSENVFSFTPGSDAIIKADQLIHLHRLLHISRRARKVLTVCFVFSALYNTAGLSFAISGHLTPLVATILMPLSSISVVLVSTVLVRLRN